jgi:hypothetical protein
MIPFLSRLHILSGFLWLLIFVQSWQPIDEVDVVVFPRERDVEPITESSNLLLTVQFDLSHLNGAQHVH